MCSHAKEKYVHRSNSDNPEIPSCMIQGAVHSYEECKVMPNYGNKYKNQTDSIGKKTALNKHVKFNNTTEVNGKELNTMVQKSVTATLKGGKKEIQPSGQNIHQ